MSEPTGYRESPDTSDGPVAEDQTGQGQAGQGQAGQGQAGQGQAGQGQAGQAPEDGVALTTDDEAQHDDGIVRPGNTPD